MNIRIMSICIIIMFFLTNVIAASATKIDSFDSIQDGYSNISTTATSPKKGEILFCDIKYNSGSKVILGYVGKI